MSEVITNPGYYAIIPASVRYDERICPNAKLLYGEITALTNSKGYCWATNRYFADLYKVSNTSISKWIRQLIDAGHLSTKIEFKKGSKQIDKRRLKLTTPIEQKLNTPITKVNDPTQQKLKTPIEQKLKENNTVLNNTINNTINSIGSAGTSAVDKSVFNHCRNYWLAQVHEGWHFNAIQGTALHDIISKLKASIKKSGDQVTDKKIITAFEVMMQALPEWFQDKELNVINSKYNEIVTQIKNSKNGTTNNPRANAYANSIFA